MSFKKNISGNLNSALQTRLRFIHFTFCIKLTTMWNLVIHVLSRTFIFRFHMQQCYIQKDTP